MMTTEFELPYDFKPRDPKAQFALLFHGVNNNNITTVTHHPIENNEIQFGESVSLNSTLAMLTAATTQNTDATRQLHRPNVLVNDDAMCLWVKPPHIATLRFKVRKTIVVKRAVPAILFKRTRNSLTMFALKHSYTALTPDTALFHFPGMNLSSHGDLCLGDATLDPQRLDDLESNENAFFDYYCTHVNHRHTLNTPHSNQHDSKDKGEISTKALLEFWVDTQANVLDFEHRWLQPTRFTIRDLM